ncbi:MAG: orotate phosphoribosyltransferase [bacterium]|nr:orotate phosphoribosyltransferase [bacterium]
MQDYQKRFIDFLVKSGALTFGDFITKSGRKTPYFVNTGNFNSGGKISELGTYYASHLVSSGLTSVSVIFGPAYKGIPLSVTTASALFQGHKLDIGFCFNRKEAKDHGDAGTFVGSKISDGSKVVIVEDVITAGTTVREVVPMIKGLGKVDILGVIISVDRSEKGSAELSAVKEAEQSLGVKVFPIVTIHEIVSYLSTQNNSGIILSEEMNSKIAQYLEIYGAK